jgi:hypothetical protein
MDGAAEVHDLDEVFSTSFGAVVSVPAVFSMER